MSSVVDGVGLSFEDAPVRRKQNVKVLSKIKRLGSDILNTMIPYQIPYHSKYLIKHEVASKRYMLWFGNH